MASSAPKVPIPLPLAGVIADKSPRAIGADGLVSSKNWIGDDGRFRVRDGLDYIVDDYTAGYSDALSYINESDDFSFANLHFGLYNTDFPQGPDYYAAKWVGWGLNSDDATSLTNSATWETWQAGDPDFLNHGGDGYFKVTFDDVPTTDLTMTVYGETSIAGQGYLQLEWDADTPVLNSYWIGGSPGDTIDYYLSDGTSYITINYGNDGAVIFLNPTADPSKQLETWGVPGFPTEGVQIPINGSDGFLTVVDGVPGATGFVIKTNGSAAAGEELVYYSATETDVTVYTTGVQADGVLQIVSPMVATGAAEMTGRVKVAGTNANSKVGLRILGFDYYDDDGVNDWTRSDYESSGELFYIGEEVFQEDLEWDDPDDYLEATFNNIQTEANYLALLITFYPAASGDEFAISEADIQSGFVLGERPNAVFTFQVDEDSTQGVASTKSSLYAIQSDYSWDSIGDWPTTITSDNVQPVFKTFAGTVGGASQDRYMIGVNDESEGIYWNGTGTVNTLTMHGGGVGPTNMICKSLVTIFRRVIYLGVLDGEDDDGNTGLYTDTFSIDEWDRATTKFRLVDTPGFIVTGLEMGNMQAAIYKTDSIYVAIGQVLEPPFRFELRAANVEGPCSAGSVVAINDGLHAYLTKSADVVLFDGVRPRSVGSHVQAYLKKRIDFEKIDQSYLVYDDENKRLFIVYVPYNDTSPKEAVILDMTTQQATLWPQVFPAGLCAGGDIIIDLSKTIDQLGDVPIDDLRGVIDSYGSTRKELVFLDPLGRVTFFSGHKDLDGPIYHSFETGMYDMGSITSYKTVHEIDHLFLAATGEEIGVELLVSLSGHERESSGVQTLQVYRNGKPLLTGHRTTGRLFSLRMSGNYRQGVEWAGSEASVTERGL